MDWLVKQVRDVTTQSQYYQMFSSSLRCYRIQIQWSPGGPSLKAKDWKKRNIIYICQSSPCSNRYFAYFSVKRQCGCCWVWRGREVGGLGCKWVCWLIGNWMKHPPALNTDWCCIQVIAISIFLDIFSPFPHLSFFTTLRLRSSLVIMCVSCCIWLYQYVERLYFRYHI